MKFLITLGLALVIGITLMVSCGPSAAEKAARAKEVFETRKGNLEVMSNSQYTLIRIGSCEYIKGWIGGSDGGPFFTHKGDCSNPIHVYNYNHAKDSI
jgi:hypothetical protein